VKKPGKKATKGRGLVIKNQARTTGLTGRKGETKKNTEEKIKISPNTRSEKGRLGETALSETWWKASGNEDKPRSRS